MAKIRAIVDRYQPLAVGLRTNRPRSVRFGQPNFEGSLVAASGGPSFVLYPSGARASRLTGARASRPHYRKQRAASGALLLIHTRPERGRPARMAGTSGRDARAPGRNRMPCTVSQLPFHDFLFSGPCSLIGCFFEFPC